MSRITIRLTEQQYALLEASARRASQPLSAHLREQLLAISGHDNRQQAQLLASLDVCIRLQLLKLTQQQPMTPEMAINHYKNFREEAEEKFNCRRATYGTRV